METLLLLMSLTWPMEGVITQTPSVNHPAIDIACVEGTPVVAAHGGVLTGRRDRHLGIVGEVRGSGLVSTYAHLASLDRGRWVSAGEIIGTCGNTGQWTTGPHLHFSVEYVENLGTRPR